MRKFTDALFAFNVKGVRVVVDYMDGKTKQGHTVEIRDGVWELKLRSRHFPSIENARMLLKKHYKK